MERIETGISGLDEVLFGGLPRYATILIAGTPGSGKTILSQNILFNISKKNGTKVLYFSTISEPQLKVIRHQQKFSFFDHDIFMNLVSFYDLGQMFRNEGLSGTIKEIESLVQQLQPQMVVIDSVKALSALSSFENFREFIYEINIRLSVWECTALLVSEYTESEVLNQPEAAIVDGIIYLYGTEERKMQKRYLRVLKMRGIDFAPGEHFMNISERGIEVFPRLPFVPQIPVFKEKDKKTGIHELDLMMGGGIPAGSITFVTGGTGTGKTLLALNWGVQGCREGENVLLVTFDESSGQLVQNSRCLGWDLQSFMDRGLLKLLHMSPIELDLDMQIYLIQAAAREHEAVRVIIDSISSFEVGFSDKIKFTDTIWRLSNYFRSQGVALMLISESPELFSIPPVSSHPISHVCDNIIYFRFIEDHFNIKRIIGILKMRGRRHLFDMREFKVTERGPEVDRQTFSRYANVFGSSAGGTKLV